MVPTGLGLHSFPDPIRRGGVFLVSAVGVALCCVALPSPREQINFRGLGSRCLGLDHLHVLEDYINDIAYIGLTHTYTHTGFATFFGLLQQLLVFRALQVL